MSALRQPDPAELLSAFAPPPTAAPALSLNGAAPAATAGGGKVVPFLLADIGEGIAEVEMMQWFVREGDAVKQFDRLCEVQSDKATVEISSRYDGVVKRVHHDVGAIVKVRLGWLLIRLLACCCPFSASELDNTYTETKTRWALRSWTSSCLGTRRPPRPPSTTRARPHPCPRLPRHRRPLRPPWPPRWRLPS